MTQSKDIDLRHMAQLIALLGLPIATILGKAIFDTIATLVVAIFLFHVWRSRSWKIFDRPWIKAGCAFWLWQIASFLWAYEPMTALVGGLIWGRFFLFGVALAYWILPNDKYFQRIWFAMLAAYLCFMGIDTVFQYYFRVDFMGEVIAPGVSRLRGPLSKPIIGSMIFYFLLPVLAHALYTRKITRMNLFYMTSAAVCVLAVILSGERSSLLLVLMGLSLMTLVLITRKNVGMLLVFFAITAVTLFLQFFVLDQFNTVQNAGIKTRQTSEIMEDVDNFSDTAYGRIWKDAWLTIEKHPLLGVGTKNIKPYWCKLGHQVNFTENCPMHPHNPYLEIWGEGGLIGLTLFLLMMGLVLREFFTSWKIWRDDPVVMGALITVLVRLWPVMVATSHTRSIPAFSFWMMVGWGIALIETRKAEVSQT